MVRSSELSEEGSSLDTEERGPEWGSGSRAQEAKEGKVTMRGKQAFFRVEGKGEGRSSRREGGCRA
jgi:hypothetical protein